MIQRNLKFGSTKWAPDERNSLLNLPRAFYTKFSDFPPFFLSRKSARSNAINPTKTSENEKPQNGKKLHNIHIYMYSTQSISFFTEHKIEIANSTGINIVL